MNPIEIPVSELLVSDNTTISSKLNTNGIAVIKLSDITRAQRDLALENTKFYNTANSIFDEEHKISEPTMEEKLNPKLYKHRKAGDDNAGFIHQYATPIHHLLQENPKVRSTLEIIYQNPNFKYMQNRLRVCRKFKNDANSLHIEGKDLFSIDPETNNITINSGEIASLIGLTGIRRFIFWNLNGANLEPLYKYWIKNGKKEFTKICPIFMNTNYPNRRKVVNVDCGEHPHMIIWKETTPHEIAHSPSISAFISPISNFNNSIIWNVTSFQPNSFNKLTYHQSNLLAICYSMGGGEWPSGKKLYQFCHHRAYTHFNKKIKSTYLVNGKFKMKIITNGTINQHDPQYKEALANRNIVIPEIAFNQDMPKFVVDILSLSDTILKDYGFIVDTPTLQ